MSSRYKDCKMTTPLSQLKMLFAPLAAPAQPASDVEDLALRRARGSSPPAYVLIPQNNGKEILQKKCEEHAELKTDESYLGQYTCVFGSRRMHVTARSVLDPQKKSWSAWEYTIAGGPPILGNANDVGLLLYLKDRTSKPCLMKMKSRPRR